MKKKTSTLICRLVCIFVTLLNATFSDDIQYSLYGSGPNYGVAQVTREGKTGYVCATNTTESGNAKADTACRSVGFDSGDYYPMELPTSETYNWWSAPLKCNGTNMEFLHLCSRDWSFTSGGKYDDCYNRMLQVFCYGKFRFHSQFKATSGIVLKMQNDEYYAFCADNIDIHTASVICQDLGFVKARKLLSSVYFYDEHSVGFYDFQCAAGATNMKACSTTFNVTGACTKGKLTIACVDSNSTPEDGQTRVLNSGVVQVSQYGVWGGIDAYNSWGDTEAKIVCTENGFEYGNKRDVDNLPLARWMFDVNCLGNEERITACPHGTTPNTTTSRYRVLAGANCYNSSQDYRLDNGHYGRLLKKKDDIEGFVCNLGSDTWDIAGTVCRTLGYFSGDLYSSPDLSDESSWWVNKFTCSNHDEVLTSCNKASWDYTATNISDTVFNDCTHKTISVYCYGRVTFKQPHVNSGIVRYGKLGAHYYHALCAYGFEMAEGNAACKDMGFAGVSRILPPANSSYQRVVAYDYNCLGNEESLMDCPFVNSTSCEGNLLANIECTDDITIVAEYTVATQPTTISQGSNNQGHTASMGNSTRHSDGLDNKTTSIEGSNNQGHTASMGNSTRHSDGLDNKTTSIEDSTKSVVNPNTASTTPHDFGYDNQTNLIKASRFSIVVCWLLVLLISK